MADDPSEAPPTPKTDTAKTAGRGGLAVAAAKGYFLLVGFVQQTMLQRILGKTGYGDLSRVFGIANIANNVVVQTSIFGASRSIAGAEDADAASVQRKVLRHHALIAPIAALLFLLIAPQVAKSEGAAHLVTHVRIGAAILLLYGLYTPLVGLLNGKKRFLGQAGLDVIYATLRTVGLLGGAYLLKAKGSGPLGSMIGFALAALLIVPAAVSLVGIGKPGSAGPALGKYLKLLAPLALSTLLLNTLMQADINLLGYFAHQKAIAAGLAGKAAENAASAHVGVYRACQLLAFLPYQGLFAISFILFPLLAGAYAKKDKQAVAEYVTNGMRLSVLFVAGVVGIVAGLSNHLLHFISPAEIADHGGKTLRVLAIGQGFFALYGISTTVLNSVHREKLTVVFNGLATLIAAGFCVALVKGEPGVLTERVASGVSLAMVVALAVGGVSVYRTTGAFIPIKTAVRAMGAFGVCLGLGNALPLGSKVMTFVYCTLVGLAYIAVLVISRELGKQDINLVLKVLGRKPLK